MRPGGSLRGWAFGARKCHRVSKLFLRILRPIVLGLLIRKESILIFGRVKIADMREELVPSAVAPKCFQTHDGFIALG